VSTNKIILVHGWATDNRVWGREGLFEALVDALIESTYFHFHNINLPGHGGERRWDEPTLRPAVKEVLALLPEEPGLAIGMGWSLGAQVIMASAMEAPERFKALILVGATPSFVRREGFPWARKGSVVKRMLMDMKKGPVETLKRFSELNFTEEELKTPGAISFLEQYGTTLPSFKHDDLTAALKSLMETDLRERLILLNLPTLIIHGGEDSVCPVGAARYLSENIKGSELEIFEGAGHAPFITKPERFNKLVKEFIKGL
jgi:pimeloyl-[acyl-carrier protein] methyl ester esterase